MVTTRSACWAGCVFAIVLSKFLHITHAGENAQLCLLKSTGKDWWWNVWCWFGDVHLKSAFDGWTVCNISTEYVHDLLVSNLQRWTCVFVFVFLQLDLEPEGKVYIHILLTGSFIDGKVCVCVWDCAEVVCVRYACLLSDHTIVHRQEHLRVVNLVSSCLVDRLTVLLQLTSAGSTGESF